MFKVFLRNLRYYSRVMFSACGWFVTISASLFLGAMIPDVSTALAEGFAIVGWVLFVLAVVSGNVDE